MLLAIHMLYHHRMFWPPYLAPLLLPIPSEPVQSCLSLPCSTLRCFCHFPPTSWPSILLPGSALLWTSCSMTCNALPFEASQVLCLSHPCSQQGFSSPAERLGLVHLVLSSILLRLLVATSPLLPLPNPYRTLRTNWKPKSKRRIKLQF